MSTTGKNAKNFIVSIDQEKVEPDLAKETVIKYDPLNRSGKEGGFYLTDEGELHIENEKVMEAHKMAINKYPHDDAIKLIRLDREFGDKIHQFGENSFRLYGLPEPQEGRVVGILGRNGIGKSTALKILSGQVKPNLGEADKNPGWDQVMKRYRGTQLQDHFKDLSNDNVNAAFKPQQVDKMPELHRGKVKGFLEQKDERGVLEEVSAQLDITQILERDMSELSGGELQRVAIAATLVRDASMYVLDEPSSFLDVKQRLNIAEIISNMGDEREVLVVEHDLATLDLISSTTHLFHGEPQAYGMVSNSFSTRQGINQYLDGYLQTHNLRIRDDSIKFDRAKRSQVENKAEVIKYPRFRKSFGDKEFSLDSEPGSIHEEEILGILGENGVGKTTLAKMLAGGIEPDHGESPEKSISYKPQYLQAQDKTVEQALKKHVNPEEKRFKTRISEPLELEELFDQNLEELSGGELQRVGVAICLARDADIYLLDEPSAYLDVESRVELGKTLKRFARKTGKPLLVIDHDLLLMDYIADRAIIFSGEPGKKGTATQPMRIEEAMNRFLKQMDLTFRKDPDTGRPRANKPGSQKDQKQRKRNEYYEQ
jgi:Predicted ATPase, RNase L inhibitor (RLI) homolog